MLKNRTYLTVQINRAKEEATLDPANTFAAFTAKLSSEAQASTAERVAVIDALKASVNKNQRYRDAKKLIDFAQSVKWPDGTKSEKKALDAVTVSALAAVATKIETSSTQLRDPSSATRRTSMNRKYRCSSMHCRGSPASATHRKPSRRAI